MELTVKTSKRMLIDNNAAYGRLCQDHAARTVVTLRNTPKQDIGMSQAEILYGQAIKNQLPILRGKYQVHIRWREMQELRERAVAKKHLLNLKQ